jgi:hypothetical protein
MTVQDLRVGFEAMITHHSTRSVMPGGPELEPGREDYTSCCEATTSVSKVHVGLIADPGEHVRSYGQKAKAPVV